MHVIRNRKVVPDRWRRELGGTGEPATGDIAPGDVIVSLQRWLGDRAALLARGTRVGVRLEPGDGIERLVEAGPHALQLVEIEFPGFAEGRGYSHARLLRSRHDFHGDIRACGDVSRDRLAFMERCGFNAFVLPPGHDLDDALGAFDEIGAAYQPAADAGVIVAARRGYRAPAAA